MTFYLQQTLSGPSFEAAVSKVKNALTAEGFGILSEIDVAAILKAKIDTDFRPYRILGACNPRYAKQALEAEPMIGVMLPCSVIIQQHGDQIQAEAIDPVATMSQLRNSALDPIASVVREHLLRAIRRAATSENTMPVRAEAKRVTDRPQGIGERPRNFEKRLDAVIYQFKAAGLISLPKTRDVAPKSRDLGELERELIALKSIIPELVSFLDRSQAEDYAKDHFEHQSEGK